MKMIQKTSIHRMLALVLALALAVGMVPAANATETMEPALGQSHEIGMETMAELGLADEEPAEQSSISLSVGADESRVNFTWYCNEAGNGSILLAKAGDLVNGNMPEDAAEIAAVATPANKSGYFSNQATATGLISGTTYAYQLVNGTTKSEIMTFTTTTEGAFSFAFAGDPQIGAGNVVTDTAGWENTLNQIVNSRQFEGVDFLLSAGDQVNTASDEKQYNGYLEHDALKGLPVATVIGNHDSGSAAYGQHFNVPNETAYGATTAGNDYYYVYNGVLFMILNSNNRSTAEHKAFMESAMEATADLDIAWKIVSFHHSIYSVASHAVDSDILARRQELAPLFQELDIDVVLMGHDHVYCRTYMMDGLTPMTDASIYDDENYSSITDPEGVLYVTANSASGSKFYALKNAVYDYSAVLNQERVPNISRVDVSENEFTVTTYRTSDMSVVDQFTIHKTNAPAALAITAEPETFAGKVGDTARFTVAANRDDVTYQWYYSNNGWSWSKSSMAGCTTDTLSVKMTAARVGQQYKVVVTDSEGNTVTSRIAELTVASSAAKIVENPADAVVSVGAAVSFTVKAEGDGLIYRWMYSNNGGASWSKSTAPGAVTATLSIEAKAFRNGQMYKCVVTDANGNAVESTAAAMIVK